MEKEKSKLVDWIKAIIILILCVAVMMKVYNNTSVNEEQEIKIQALINQLQLTTTRDYVEYLDSANKKNFLNLWMSTLDIDNQKKIDDWLAEGHLYCLEFKDIALMNGLTDDKESFRGQVLLMRYEKEQEASFTAFYKNGRVRCFGNVESPQLSELKEIPCEDLCGEIE